ncbi:SRPBCC family protein [Nocardia sp. SYP-A9097]|uniref:SRPBCC family protein n=1 Tax=Nocardia sp. SYP-A9097 TaxID=2663237 RepID=UPI00189153AD|nr:SRPBCC family protein [Nocardia sp. SYP-A9097]
MRTSTATAVAIASAATGLALGYRFFARNACLTWGATEAEAARALPGDGLLTEPDVVTTRAVTIAAEPEEIFPWLVQMGSARGGAYTYDWIENLFGLNMHSADRIMPQWQQLAVDDVLPLGDSGPRMRVAILDRPHTLVFVSEDKHWVWAFELVPTTGGTRLISRNRIAAPDAALPQRVFTMLVMEPGSLIMESKMLLGIKKRVERVAAALPAVVTKAPERREEGPYRPVFPTRTIDV